ncbi:MAG TPA: hypothetical protein VFZ98_10355 [Vicinamibacterales bacterium]
MTERDLAKALRRLNDATVPPPVDPAREAALMATFDAAHAAPVRPALAKWLMTALAAAAVALIAVLPPTQHPAPSTRHQAPSTQHPESVTDFIVVPGAANLPPMESGSLVRIDLPVSVLPSLGVTPPATGRATVKADLVIGQDGLTRAVRLVN